MGSGASQLTHPFLQELTTTQREAVVHEQGPLLVLAGAGTGKTTVITRRIAWLISEGLASPKEILALTFTEKAALEMEERVDLLIPYGYVDVTVKTFHAFGDTLVRDHALRLGLSSNVRVLSRAEQVVLLRQNLFDLPLTQYRPLYDPTRYLEALTSMFARAKDEAVTPEEFLAYATTQHSPGAVVELANSYATYQRLLREADAVDFGDQILLAIQLLDQHPEVRSALQQRFRYILVDEFQDTNYAQFELVKLLAAKHQNIAVVADDDQSIYKFRGAAISNVLGFKEHYPGARGVVLTENHRSPQAILDAAYRLIRFNDPDRLEVKHGIDKRLLSAKGEGTAPWHIHFDTATSEADGVAQLIAEGVEAGRRYGDFAILVRSNNDADPFLRSLNMRGIPWTFSGNQGLYAS
jgi:DNA helicase-2/ATP-dependent DNA helicase PcrA